MDLGSLSLGVCVKSAFMMFCLLGVSRCSVGDRNDCPCPEIPQLDLTVHQTGGCYKINQTFRYKCIEGYVRKAGTSNLIRCEGEGSAAWTIPKLSCIPDPRRTTTQPPNTTAAGLDATTTIVICAIAVIACASIVISFWCYRRRTINILPQTEEEMSPMK